MNDTQKIARAVKFFREERHWSRGTLATKSGLAASYISMLERGQRTGAIRDTTLFKLAEAFDVTVKELIEFDDPKSMPMLREKGPAYGEPRRSARLVKLLEQLTDDQLEALELFVERLLARGIGRG